MGSEARGEGKAQSQVGRKSECSFSLCFLKRGVFWGMVVPVTLERAGRVQLDWMGWMFKGEGNLFGSFCWVSGLHMCVFDVCE